MALVHVSPRSDCPGESPKPKELKEWLNGDGSGLSIWSWNRCRTNSCAETLTKWDMALYASDFKMLYQCSAVANHARLKDNTQVRKDEVRVSHTTVNYTF